MKVLFFPQNETHLDNMIPVADFLQNSGIEIVFLDTRNIYKQNLIYDSRFTLELLDIRFNLKQSFYHLGFKARIKFIASHKNKIIQFASQFDFFVFGNDGALQRIMINYANRNNKQTFIILDGIISDYSYSFFDIFKNDPDNFRKNFLAWNKSFIKNIVSNIAKHLPMNCYLPSNAGCAKVDAVFLIGQHSKQSLKKICDQRKSYAYGLPYMSRLFRYESISKIQKSANLNEIKILFLSSAYKWHGLFDLDVAQHRDIALLCDIISKHNINNEDTNDKIKLRIKLHPREERQDYEVYSAYDFIEIMKNENLDDTILESDILFSHISTTIIESILLGKPIYSLMINFPYWKFKNSFISNEAIQKIFTLTQLREIIKTYRRTETERKMEVSNKIFTLVSSTTPKSATMISEKIINTLSQKGVK